MTPMIRKPTPTACEILMNSRLSGLVQRLTNCRPSLTNSCGTLGSTWLARVVQSDAGGVLGEFLDLVHCCVRRVVWIGVCVSRGRLLCGGQGNGAIGHALDDWGQIAGGWSPKPVSRRAKALAQRRSSAMRERAPSSRVRDFTSTKTASTSPRTFGCASCTAASLPVLSQLSGRHRSCSTRLP